MYRRFRTFQNAAGHFAVDGRETLEKFVEGVIVLEIIKKRFHGNARAFEDGRSAQDVAIHGD